MWESRNLFRMFTLSRQLKIQNLDDVGRLKLHIYIGLGPTH